ncbi:tetratricopeptide repeat protein 1-like [Senna tora]|uniref:Tetratricopeptide repeat protein 1-like n=1 Tax=Senna tora TaxID=362788 RepID=A0A835C595_9FABA|nr:tetratricopeptide repeat protein 1-like [Senna tora]
MNLPPQCPLCNQNVQVIRHLFRDCPIAQQAYICQGDAFLELKQYDSAEKSYLASVDIDPSIRRSKSFKVAL